MELIILTPEQLKQIILNCLSEFHKSGNEEIEEKINQEPPRNLYGLKELSEFLGCCIGTAYKIKNSGKIRYIQFGRKLIFDTKEILDDLNSKSYPIRKVKRQN